MLFSIIFLLWFDQAHSDTLDVLSKVTDTGIKLVNHRVLNQHTLRGNCQVITSNTDHFPQPCHSINLFLTSKKTAKKRSFQTDDQGKFTVTALDDEEYQLGVNSQGYSLAEDASTLVHSGQDIVITVARSNN